MLNLKEVLAYKLKFGANTFNVVEILADRLILAEALNKSVEALRRYAEGHSGNTKDAIETLAGISDIVELN